MVVLSDVMILTMFAARFAEVTSLNKSRAFVSGTGNSAMVLSTMKTHERKLVQELYTSMGNASCTVRQRIGTYLS